MKILRASEDYLETMLMMQESHGYIRSLDVAEHLGVTKASVSYAVKRLRENGYITMGSDSLISLTPLGLDIAQRMYTRHKILTKLLIHMGVDEAVARVDACKIEHDISDTTFAAICQYLERSNA